MIAAAITWVLTAQRTLQELLGASIHDLGQSVRATLVALCFALALGAVHAMTPGHGKAVVFSYFLGRHARPLAGLAMAGKIALAHSLSAVTLVLLFGAATSSFGRPAGPAAHLQTFSYAAIACIGAFYLWRALAAGSATRDAVVGGAAFPFVIGLLPCPLTMLMFSYALVNGLPIQGAVLATVVGAGAAATIGAVGLLGIGLRRGLFAALDPGARGFALLLRGLEIVSSAAILIIGGLLLLGGAVV